MKKLFTLLFCLAIFSIASGTDVSGTISVNTTWDLAGSPYIVTGNLIVNNGAALTIDSLVEVKFNNSRSMNINGRLNAKNVSFTSSDPSPSPGIWDNIQFGNSSYSGQGTLLNCSFNYGNQVYVQNGTVNITGCTINYFYYYGLQTSDTLVITDTYINLPSYYSSYGYALLANSGAYVTANNLDIANCKIGYYIETNGKVFTNNGCSITGADQYGIYVKGQLDMSNTDIDLTGYSYLGYGIEAGNGSIISLDQVNITQSYIALIINSTANISTNNCSFTGNTWPGWYSGPGAVTTTGTNNFTGNSRNAFYVNFSSLSTSWNLPTINVPYYFSTCFTVDNTGILTIFSQNILKFNYYWCGLDVNGTLIANANPGENIYLTSDEDDNWGGDTNNDGSSTSPAPGNWNGITFNNQSIDEACVLRRCKIRFAGYNYGGNVNTINASPTIDYCELSNSYYGIKIQSASNPIFTNNVIGSSQMTPIALSYEANPIFSNNTLSLSDNAYDAIGLLGGTLTTNAVLPVRNVTNIPNITYLMLDNITIPQGLTLTINKGVVIKAYYQYYGYEYRKFIIQGKLTAIGTADSMIVFTSARDDNFGNPFDTNKDGSQTNPTIGDWGGVAFKVNSDAESRLENCRIYYGDNNDYYVYPTISPGWRQGGQITLDNASPEIIYCDIKHCEFGIYCGGNSQPLVWNDSFDNTTITPIAMSLSAAPDFSENTIVNPGYYAISLIGEELGVSGVLKQKNFAGYTNITYILLQDLYVNSGTNISIDSGVVIKVNPNSKIEVNGGLKLTGGVVPGHEIVFTSLKDDNEGNPNDTNGDGSTTSPAAGDWKRLQYNETSDDYYCALSNFQIKYCGNTGWNENSGAVAFVSASSIVKNAWILNSSTYGFWINGNSVPLIDGAIIQNCTYDPIAMSLKSDPQFTNISFADNGSNGIRIIEGMLSSNASLAKRNVAGINNIAYIVNNLTISSNAILLIEPGVVIKFPSTTWDSYIIVNGAIIANGTQDEKIVFTSDKDDSQGGDTNNDGNVTIPNKGDWLYLEFNNSGNSPMNSLQNCIFSYGGRFSLGNISNQLYAKSFGIININSTVAVVSGCVLEQSGTCGIGIYGNSNPVIQNNEFSNINFSPITLSMFSNPTFIGNSVSNIGLLGLGVAIENYSVDGTIPQRSFAGFENITYLLYSSSYYSNYYSTINSGTQIIIPEGIVFKTIWINSPQSSNSFGIEINGSLVIVGSPNNKVVFTDYRDDNYGNPFDTNGDGSITTPQINGCFMLNFTELSDDANCLINHTVFKYQNNAIQIQQASPSFYNCLFDKNNWGISMSGISHPFIDNCTFNNLKYTPLLFSIVSYPASVSNNIISGTTYKALGVKGETMAQNVTLPKRSFAGITNIPYYFHENFIVGTSSIMTIESGVVLKFNGGTGLTIKKGLIAESGTELNNSIVFTDIWDDYYGGDTNSDSTATHSGYFGGQHYSWYGLIFDNESNDALCRLNNCKVRYAGYNYPTYWGTVPGIRTNNASPSILNSSIMFNQVGIYANGASNPMVNNCDIYSNQVYGLQNAGLAFNINAENCWWGNNTGPTHSANPGGTGDAVTNMVDYNPYRTTGANIPLMGDVSLNGSIMAYDASLILFYIVNPITYPLNATQLMVADVSGNGSATAYDASLILQYVVGIINYFPAELLIPVPVYTSDVELTIGDITVIPGEEFTIPINITNVSGIYASQLDLTYDPNLLEAINVESLLPDMNPTIDIDEENGKIHIAFAGLEPLEGNMTIANLAFKTFEGISGNIVSQVGADFFMANETNLTDNVKNGTVTINGFSTDINNNSEKGMLFCYPNPFIDRMTISYTVTEDSEYVGIMIFDLMGNLVSEIVSGYHYAESYSITWNGTDSNGTLLPEGIYLIKMTSGRKLVVQKIQIVR